MEEDNEILHKVILTRLLRLNATAHGLVTGIVAAVGIFLATNWLVLKGGDVVGPHLSLLNQFFLGYEVTFVGSLVGAAYAFGVGFAVGHSVAALYNWIVGFKESETH